MLYQNQTHLGCAIMQMFTFETYVRTSTSEILIKEIGGDVKAQN
jgi:hypothetical protein